MHKEAQRLLEDRRFSPSRQSGRLLRYLLEASERGESPDQYRVGVEALDLGVGFDPRSHSVVRVAMSRLRKQLEAYYRDAGAGQALRIELGDSGYRLRWEKGAPEDRAGAATSLRRPVVRVEPIAGYRLSAALQSLPEELTREWAGQLAATGRLRVRAPWGVGGSGEGGGVAGDPAGRREEEGEGGEDFVLHGSLEQTEAELVLRMHLQVPTSGQLLDSLESTVALESFRRGDLEDALQGFAVEVGTEFGLLDRYLLKEGWGSAGGAGPSAYHRFVLAQVFEGRFSSGRLQEALAGVGEGLAESPFDPTLLGASAVLEVLCWQDDPGATRLFPTEAREQVAIALNQDPTAAFARLGAVFLAMAEKEAERLDRLSREFLADRTVAPPLRVLAAGCRLVADLDPEGTVAQVDALLPSSHGTPRVFHCLRAVHEYRVGRLRSAFAEVERSAFEIPWFDALLRGLLAMDLGWEESAHEERARLLAEAPGFADRAEEVLDRIFAPPLRDFLLTKWRRLAGAQADPRPAPGPHRVLSP